jgi:WD40 repeat protein
MAFPASEPGGGSLPWIVASVFAIVVIAGGLLAWMQPWKSAETTASGKEIVHNPPQPEPPVVPKKNGESPVIEEPDPPEVDIGPEPRVVAVAEKKNTGPEKIEPKPKDSFTEPITFRGHKGSVYGVAVNRTAMTILSISDDRTVLHYAPNEPDKHGVIHKLISPGVAVVFCNEDRDAVFCDGGDIVVYDISERKPKASFENPRGGVRCMAASRDGTFVLSGATDGCVRWWSVASKSLAHTLDIDDKATVTAIAITPNAKSAAIGLSDGRICLWDLQKRSEIKRWKGHAGAVNSLAYSPDAQRFVSTSDDAIVNVWQASGTLVRKLSGHKEAVLAAGWCSDGQRVITAGIDKQVRVWDESKGWKSERTYEMPEKVFSLAIDARDRFVLVGLSGGAVRLTPLQ